jgi:flavodoxin
VKSVVVYESLWGNTAAVARAVADVLGPKARALSTAEADAAALEGAGLIVAGAPVLGFKLPTEKMREAVRANPGKAPAPPDLSHPSMRAWLEALPAGVGRGAAFNTQVRGPFGHAAPEIAAALERAGYAPLAEPAAFVVKGKFGPLKDGELERARQWGAELAVALGPAGE